MFHTLHFYLDKTDNKLPQNKGKENTEVLITQNKGNENTEVLITQSKGK